MSTNVPVDLKLYILSRRETTVLIIEHLISEYLKLWNKGNPENELPNTPGLLQVYIWEYSSGNSCRCLDKCHQGWVFAFLIMICDLDGKYLWSQGPVCKIVPGEDKWHFLWTWAHCILWSSRLYRMFLVQEDKKDYLKCTWQGELGKVPMEWVDCEESGRCQWPLCLTEAVLVQGQAQPEALPPLSLGIWPKWSLWIYPTHQTGLVYPKMKLFTPVLERNWSMSWKLNLRMFVKRHDDSDHPYLCNGTENCDYLGNENAREQQFWLSCRVLL